MKNQILEEAKQIFFAAHNEGKGIISSYTSNQITIAVLEALSFNIKGGLTKGKIKDLIAQLKTIE